MRYRLEQFPSIPEEACLALAAHQISDTDQLLAQSATPGQRQRLGEKTGINEQQLLKWSSLSDLIRVKGVGIQLAELFVMSGVAHNVQMLCQIGADVDPCRAQLKTHIQMLPENTQRVPGKNQLREILVEATELRPRLVLAEYEADPAFRTEVFKKAWESRKHSLKLGLGALLVVLAAIAILYGLNMAYINRHIEAMIIPGSQTNQIMIAVTRISFRALQQSLLSAVGIIVAMLLLTPMFYDLPSHLMDTWFVVWLFRRPQDQTFYWVVSSINLKKQVRSYWWSLVLFGVLAIGLVIYAYQMMVADIPMDIFVERLAWPVILIGILLGVWISVPVLQYYRKEMPQLDRYRQVSAQRYLIYYLGKSLLIPYAVVVFTKVLLPWAFDLHDQFYQNRIVPKVQQAILEQRQELLAMEFEDEFGQELQTSLINHIDYSVLRDLETVGMIVTQEDTPINEIFVPAALNMVVWVALTAYLLLFVVPYLMLGGWIRGGLYLLILVASFGMENLLSHFAPGWFSLQQGTLPYCLFIAFFIFANALFFDWVYDTQTEKVKLCPACDTNLDQDDLFCSECGFQQV